MMKYMKTPDYNLLDLVVTASEMAEIDRLAIENVGIPGDVLMENAGGKVAEVIVNHANILPDAHVVILCGKGNNGGDGYVVARYLLDKGAQVTAISTNVCADLKGSAALNCENLHKLGVSVLQLDVREHVSLLQQAQLVVDALLGTGVTGPLRTDLAAIVEAVNSCGAPVVAIDLPTGMETDTGQVPGACIRADWTVTMGHLKRGLLFSPAREHAGQIFVADIGFPKKVARESGVRCYRINENYIRSVLPQRGRDSFKNRCGQVLVLAGSVGMTGAAVLTSNATLRAGAGLAVLGIPESLNPIVAAKLTEVMTLPLPETEEQSLSFEATAALSEKLQWADVLAVGPGLTVHEDSIRLVKWLLQTCDKPMVLDADALNCLQGAGDSIRKSKADLVLTPHPGELSRLTGISTKEIVSDPVETVKKVAADLGVILVLKGAPTVVGSPDGYTFINATGNPGMATAGMGDVLTGVLAGLVAQGMSVLDGAIAAVYLHGLAGDLAAEEVGQAGLLAGNVADFLPLALKQFEKQNDNEIRFI